MYSSRPLGSTAVGARCTVVGARCTVVGHCRVYSSIGARAKRASHQVFGEWVVEESRGKREGLLCCGDTLFRLEFLKQLCGFIHLGQIQR